MHHVPRESSSVRVDNGRFRSSVVAAVSEQPDGDKQGAKVIRASAEGGNDEQCIACNKVTCGAFSGDIH
jgi:hypothetical protein